MAICASGEKLLQEATGIRRGRVAKNDQHSVEFMNVAILGTLN